MTGEGAGDVARTRALREHLAQRGASFYRELLAAALGAAGAGRASTAE